MAMYLSASSSFLNFVPRKTSVYSTRSFRPAVMSCASTPAVGVSETFARLRKQGKAAFIPFLTAGDPDLQTTAKALKILESSGAAIIELGLPHTNPYKDGPVIQESASRALKNGANLDNILDMVRTLRTADPPFSCPIVLFSYLEPILELEASKFMSTIKDAGIQGLIVPDLPFEKVDDLRFVPMRNKFGLELESPTEDLMFEASENNIELVLLITPETPTEQISDIADATAGFLYLVSSPGVTGMRDTVNLDVKNRIVNIKKVTDKPVAVGFGISAPEHVRQVVEWGADGVIVGSALVNKMAKAESPEEGLKELEILVKSLVSALKD